MNNLRRAAYIVTDFIDPEAFLFLVSKSKQLALGQKYVRLDIFSLWAVEHFGWNIALFPDPDKDQY